MQAIQDNGKKLSVLLLESSPNWGGQEDRLLREARWLQEHGHRVMLACRDDAAIIGRAGAAGVEARAIPFRSNVDLAGAAALARLVRREKPDLMHAHSSRDAWFGVWFRLRGFPVVRSRHTTLPAGMPAGRKLVYRHGCHRLIASAEFIAETMRTSLGISGDRVDVIGECVDTSEFSPGDGCAFRKEFGIGESAPLFGLVAMLRGEKGHDTFLRAAKTVLRSRPDARFVIVGSAASHGRVKEKIMRIIATEFGGFAQPPVIMTGFRRDIPDIMRALDCLVVPSRQEAQTLVIPQAFATGKPVIGSRVGGIPELLADGSTGFLVDPDDAGGFARRMLELAGNADLAARFGKEGRAYAERSLATDVKMGQLVASYRKTLQAAGKNGHKA